MEKKKTMYRLQNNSATNWTFHSLKLAEVFSFVNDTSYYKTDSGVRCPISTALSPTIMTNVSDVTWDQRRAMRLWNQNWFIQLPGCSHISLNPISPGQESLVPHLGTSSGKLRLPKLAPLKQMENAGGGDASQRASGMKPGWGREPCPLPNIFWKELTSCGWDLREWRAPGPHCLQACLGNGLRPVFFWKGTKWLLPLGNYHLWAFFFLVSCQKKTHVDLAHKQYIEESKAWANLVFKMMLPSKFY